MFSEELENYLTGKQIVSAKLVPSREAGFQKEGVPEWIDSEHLKLILDTGVILYLPYERAKIIDPKDSDCG